ncbi:MAG: RNA polymerase factor sigma-54 [Pseudomonadota bacterium]
MAFSQRLDMRQSQQLVMTPQLQQAIKMLQMSNLELRDFISEELERNPLLESAPAASGDAPSGADARPADTPAEGEGAPEGAGDAPLESVLADDRLSRASDTFDAGGENLYADEAQADRIADRMAAQTADGPSLDGPGGAEAIEAGAWASVGAGGSSRFDDDEFSLEARLTKETTLREALLAQLGAAKCDTPTRLVAADLVEHVEPAGYLRVEMEEVAQRLGAPLQVVEDAAELIRTFEPTGVGARDLQECLRLQLQERDRYDPAMAALLDNLPLMAKREFDKLKRICRVDADDLLQMLQEIQALDPKPGARYETELAATVIPDVFVYENRVGGWNVELNTDTLPRLVVNNGYAAEVLKDASGKNRADTVKEFLSERQQSANWLIKSIEQRARTILRVSSEIVRQQDGFFAYGVSGLRPLNLKRVADAIDMHESTVSRVTSNKFISTPRGVFELKYFFTPAIAATDGGEAYSAEAIRHRIKALIDKETAGAVLSDDRIVAILRESGVDIARRTVTKYREALGIPSSIQRRKQLAVLSVS